MNLIDELREEAAEQESGNVGDGACAADLLRRAVIEIERLRKRDNELSSMERDRANRKIAFLGKYDNPSEATTLSYTRVKSDLGDALFENEQLRSEIKELRESLGLPRWGLCKCGRCVQCDIRADDEDEKAKAKRLQAIVDPINQLRREEGDSVTIVCDNPDFGLPATAVIASGSWCGFAEQTHLADSLAEALADAVKDRESCEAGRAAKAGGDDAS